MKSELKLISIVVLVCLGLIAGISWLGSKAGAPDKVDQSILAGSARLVRGAKTADAKVTIVEFSDFQCPSCKAMEPILKQALADFPNDLELIYRHFPLYSVHANAQSATWAAEAAQQQGKFWEAHDILFDSQAQWADSTVSAESFFELFKELKMDKEKFIKDYQDPLVQTSVTEDVSLGNDLKIDSTPTLFVNGNRQTKMLSYDELKKLIDQEISKAGK